MSRAPEVHVVFQLRGHFEPTAIGSVLGIEPSRVISRGSPVGNRESGLDHRDARWLLRTESHMAEDTIEPHLTWLLDRLEPTSSELASLQRDGHETRVDCIWSSAGASGGPWITATTMERLGALGLDLVVSFLAIGDSPDVGQADPRSVDPGGS